MFDARAQSHAAVREGGPHRAPQEPFRPSPYDLYTDFAQVQALWACESAEPDELVYRCALQSIEMGLALMADAAQDERPAARSEARIEALADNIAAQVQLAARLLRQPLPAALLTARPSASPGIRGLLGLVDEHPGAVTRVTGALLHAGLPVALGTEAELAEARAALGLRAMPLPEGPFLPYDRWVQPERVARIVLREAHSPEDRIFAAVHQMSECWLRIVLAQFGSAEAHAREARWDAAAGELEDAALVLEFLGRHIELLHLMVVADYHPLRVALRGASGAQSAAARLATMSARQLLPPLLHGLKARGLGPLDVLRAPDEHPAEHRLIEAVGNVERRLAAFYFGHFQLARKVLGTASLGSLGFEVRALAERFIKPMFQELDDARYDHTMLTNLAHGNDAGRIIAEREGVVEVPAPAEVVDPAVAQRVIASYFDAIRAFDIEAWVALFHPQGTMEDPVGSRPHRGLAELRVFFLGVQRTFRHMDVRAGELDIQGGRVHTHWRAKATLYNGRDARFEGTEVFEFAPDGRIVAVRVLWDPRTVAEQLLPTAPPAAR